MTNTNILMKTVRIVVLILLSASTAISQKTTFTGYYVSVDNDTITGTFPNYSQWSKSPSRISFIPSNSSQSIDLTPLNCLKFVIEGWDTYIRYSGKRMSNPIKLEEAINNTFASKQNQYDTISSFLRLIYDANDFQLYAFADNRRNNFFYSSKGQPLEELRFKIYYDQNTMRAERITDYRQQLNVLFKEDIQAKKLGRQLAQLPYEADNFTTFLHKLFGTQQQIARTRNEDEGWYLEAGVSYNMFEASGDKSIAQVNTQYKSSVSSVIGISYLVSIRRHFNRYFFMPRLRLYNYKNSGEVEQGSMKYVTTFKTPLLAIAELNAGMNVVTASTYKLYISGGAGMKMIFNNKEEQKRYVSYYSDVYNSDEYDLGKLTINVNATAGVRLKNRLSAWATYNLPVAVSSFVLYSPQHSALQAGVGYHF